MKYKVIFYGTPSFSVPFLDALIRDADFDIVGVITEPDRKAGRGKQLKKSQIANYIDSCLPPRIDVGETGRKNDNLEKCHCEQQNGAWQSNLSKDCFVAKAPRYDIKLFKPSRVSDIKSEILNLKPDIAIVVAYGQIIPDEILDIPRYGSINIHPSDLPKYRGPSPIQSALLNGDKNTKVTIMKMDAKMDHGPILNKLNIDINEDDDYFTLEKKILTQSPQFLIKTLKKYISGKIEAKTQNHKKATFCKLIDKKDGLIDWNKSPIEIHNKIRAYVAWPKAYTVLVNNKRLIFLKTKLKFGKLDPIMVQLEGKKPILWKDFLNGYKNLLSKELTKKLL